MGQVDYFKHGDWNVDCDRCGFKRKVSDCRTTWDNLLVCADTCWEPRHPQDFVKGRLDHQSIPIARPDSQSMSLETTLSSSLSTYDDTVDMSSVDGVYTGTSLGITLDNGEIQWVHVTSDSAIVDANGAPVLSAQGIPLMGNTIYVDPVIKTAAASGNSVYIMTGDRFLVDTQVTATGL